MIKSIIVAMSRNRVIGIDNRLPWDMPADMRHFKKTTQGHPVIMGRKTYMSIGRPLPKRVNIILSKREDLTYPPACIVCKSLSEALRVARDTGAAEAFIIGGSQVYKEALPHVDKLYITEIETEVKGDTFFPIIDTKVWKEVVREHYFSDEKNPYPYAFVEYIRQGDVEKT